MRRPGRGVWAAVMLWALPAAALASDRQVLDDAWWTGPILAPGAGTLPKGHMLIEPYLFDYRPYERIDKHGARTGAPTTDNYGSLTYLLYGLTDRMTVGAIPHFSWKSSGGGLGDVTVQAQYRLTQFQEGSRLPTLSVSLGESLPTGRHDQLRGRPGTGAGAYGTTVQALAQTYAWTPGGRIVRSRLVLGYTVNGRAELKGESVYGTPAGFRGHADPGDSASAILAFEYSFTRNWVLALDLGAQRDASTWVSGTAPVRSGGVTPYRAQSGPSVAFFAAPAVEYNFSPALGVIVGARIIPEGRNTLASVTPVIAINYVR